MAYQLSELVTDIKTRAKDSSLSTELVIDFIQETQDEVLNRSRYPFMEVAETETISAASFDYDLAAVHQRKVEELCEDMLTRLSTRQLITPHKVKFGASNGRFISILNRQYSQVL